MKKLQIFSIPFINGNYSVAIKLLDRGNFMVVPSGPGLATIGTDLRYTQAVQNCDFAIPDSSFMILLLKMFKGIKIKKLSGYEFLKQFLNKKSFNENDLFLIDPSKNDSRMNYNYLTKIGIPINPSYQYIAPIYDEGEIEDSVLINRMNNLNLKPKYIIINLGSGIQEPLGLYLKQNLNFSPGIICTGAAIAFLTGSQANISPVIDKLYLGWFWRCIKNPRIFIPRYIKAIRLFFLFLKEDINITI